MVKRTIATYHNSFRGLSVEVWWLALITFINRAGTMVLPFLSLYLTEDLNLSLAQVGVIMSSFGVGSLAGSWLGGKLTDRVGYYKVMMWSLLLTGFMFIGLQFITTYFGFVVGIFLTMTVADTFRPALFVSLKAYSELENQTRSLTLIRLAINLGFSFGPFLGGLIIATLGYSGLFWVDGITCIAAVILMRYVLKFKELPRNGAQDDTEKETATTTSVFRDRPYWIFLAAVFLMGFMFLQLFSTMPLYYKEIHGLTEVHIGLLMSLNGMLIFLLEMPLIHYLENTLIDRMKIIFWSLLLLALSFFVLNMSSWTGILIVGMVLITVGEMLAFPFTNNFALNRGPEGQEGKYLALYSMAFSLSHIFGPKTGMEVVARMGYTENWNLMGALGLLAMILIFWLRRTLKNKEPDQEH
jgi:predicted MFS family arabinose efflux permease